MSPNSWFSQPVYIPGGNPETMNEANLLYPGQLGIRFSYRVPYQQAGSETSDVGAAKAYQLVQSDSTMAVAPFAGAVAWWSNQTTYKVTTTVTTLGRGRVAGVFKSAVTPGNFCCIQQKGKSTVKFVDAPTAQPTAAGLLVIPSATAAKADCLAAASAATYPILGRSAGVYNAVDATALVDLSLPDAY